MISNKSILNGLKHKVLVLNVIKHNVSNDSTQKFKLAIVGGGTAGISIGAKFARKIGAKNIVIIDPATHHCLY